MISLALLSLKSTTVTGMLRRATTGEPYPGMPQPLEIFSDPKPSDEGQELDM